MKAKGFAALLLTGILLAGFVSALAAPATSSDPLISLNYLNEVYLPKLRAETSAQVQQRVEKSYLAASDKLETVAKQYISDEDGRSYAAGFTPLTLSQGDCLILYPGSGVLLREGSGILTASSAPVIDVTSASVLAAGSSLAPGHRCLASEEGTAVLTARSDCLLLSVEGHYSLTRSGTAHTPFTDLCSTDWYYRYVHFAYNSKLFQGVSDSVFSPNSPMTRAMLATVLNRLAGTPLAYQSAGFDDVPDSAWFSGAVNWASQAGIVTGMGNNRFLPNSNVTREQMATMLYRYATSYLGMNLPQTGSLDAFPDRSSISPWAEQALCWAVGAGIMQGHSNGNLTPGGTATRAEVAAMLERFSNLID